MATLVQEQPPLVIALQQFMTQLVQVMPLLCFLIWPPLEPLLEMLVLMEHPLLAIVPIRHHFLLLIHPPSILQLPQHLFLVTVTLQ